jgi:PAS domain S-box-containing protein
MMETVEKTIAQLMEELVELCRQIKETTPFEIPIRMRDEPLGISRRHCLDVLEFLPDPTFVIDQEKRVIIWNRAIEEMTGVPKASILGKGGYAYAVPFYGEPRPIMIDLVMGDDSSFAEKYSFIHKEVNTYYAETFAPAVYGGKGAHLWGKATALVDSEGRLMGAVESIRDMTERKRGEEAIRRNEEKYRELVESANSIIMRMDFSGNIIFFNEYAQKFFGFSEDEILGRNVVGTIVPTTDSNGVDLTARILDHAQHPERYAYHESENMRRNGERVRVAWTNKALLDENGRVHELLCVGNDVTEHRRVEDALARSEREYRMLVETMNEGLRVQDENGFLTYSNDRFCEMLGYARDEVVGCRADAFFDRENAEIFEKEMEKRRRGERSSYEIEFLGNGGRRIPAIVSGTPILDKDGKYRGTFAAVTDMTFHREAEKRLKESEAKHRMIFNYSPLGILHFDEAGTITACNDSLVKIWGSSEEKLVGFNLLSSLKNKKMRSAVCACMSGKYAFYEGKYLSVTGGRISDLKAHYGPIISEDGKFHGGVGIIEDISERKQAEEYLKESERQLRLLSAELLTSQEQERKRIAGELHDSIGSSLSAIRFSLEDHMSRLEPDAPELDSLRSLSAMVQRAIDEVRRIMTDLRPAILDDLGIVATIEWFCRHFQTVYTDIRIEENIDARESDIPESLKIVIFRIVQEAFHNIVKYSRADRVEFSLLKSRDSIHLAIRDNGVGFDMAASGLLIGQAKGLGLTGMRERADLSGGVLTIDSKIDAGTSINAVWPLEAHGGRKTKG